MSFSKAMSLALFVSLASFSISITKAATPNIPPELISQLKKMTPAEQRALAQRYGIDVGSLASDSRFTSRAESVLGAPGDPLEQVEVQDIDTRESLEGLSEDGTGEGQPLERFGSALFDSRVSTFSPVDNIPVPEGYRLGVGDQLRVLFLGKEQGDLSLIVDRDGSVTLPKLGSVILSALTFPQAKQLIEKRVSEQLIGTEAIVSMGSLRSINVFMAGEVKNPGNYSMSGLTTLSQSIFVAGGIADTGSYRRIELKRQGKTVQSFDIYDLLLTGDSSADMRLQSGDVVFIPVVGPQLSISGEVVRPAKYEFEYGDTIGDLIAMSGGTRATGDAKQAFLKRFQVGASLPFIQNLNLLEEESLGILAVNGDELVVRALSERISNPIEIEGDTPLKGLIGWSEGLRIADIFKNLDSDVEPTADLNLSLLVRRKNRLNDIAVSAISLTEAILRPSSDANVVLQPFDRIIILPQADVEKGSIAGLDLDDEITEKKEVSTKVDSETRVDLLSSIVEKLERQAGSGERAQVVNISGAVREPGAYPLLGEGSIAEAVALAGGYTDAAYLKRVEVRRIRINDAQEADVEIINLNLNETTETSFSLIGRDTLRVSSIPNWSTNDTVELTGEFLFPGTYTIFEGETIGSLIDRAGGFTSDAFLNGAQYFSSAARASQALQLQKITDAIDRRIASRKSAGELGESISQESLEDTLDESVLGRVVIDLKGILDGNELADNVVDDGDTLFVPKFTNTVAVVGEVYEPGTFKFQEGLGLAQYLEIAGGTTNYALNRNTYLLKADGSVRFYRRNNLGKFLRFNIDGDQRIEAGDAIVVPTNLDYDPPLSRINAITNVIFQSFTSIAAFLSIANQ